jgi:hypothetical protein
MNMISLARFIIIVGLILVAIGGILYLFARLGVPLGRLPGDIRIERQNFSCLIALGTSLFLSILLTIILNVIVRLLNK